MDSASAPATLFRNDPDGCGIVGRLKARWPDEVQAAIVGSTSAPVNSGTVEAHHPGQDQVSTRRPEK